MGHRFCGADECAPLKVNTLPTFSVPRLYRWLAADLKDSNPTMAHTAALSASVKSGTSQGLPLASTVLKGQVSHQQNRQQAPERCGRDGDTPGVLPTTRATGDPGHQWRAHKLTGC